MHHLLGSPGMLLSSPLEGDSGDRVEPFPAVGTIVSYLNLCSCPSHGLDLANLQRGLRSETKRPRRPKWTGPEALMFSWLRPSVHRGDSHTLGGTQARSERHKHSSLDF